MAFSGVWDGQLTESDYGWQVFFDALCHAIINTGSLQQRLAGLAWSVCDLQRKNFPDEDTWTRFEELMTATTGSTKVIKARIKARTLAMGEEEARKWLQAAVRIFSNLSQEPEA